MKPRWLPARTHQAERLWNDNHPALERVCRAVARTFGLPAGPVEATVRRRLDMDVGEGREAGLRPRPWWVIASLLWVSAAALRSLLFPARRPPVRVDLLLDQWDVPVYDHFYRRVVEGLPGLSVAVFSREESPPGLPDGMAVHHRPYDAPYPPAVAARMLPVLWWAFLRWGLSRASVSPFYVAVILLRKIGTYYADMDKVQARLFLSCADNYFEGVRHAVYRQAAVGRVDVIQNAIRGALTNDVHLFADTYFAQGEATRAMIPGLTVERLVPVGSFRAQEARRTMPAEVETRFDVAFIEQLLVGDMEGNNTRPGYDQVIDHLARLARRHPRLRICMVNRPGDLPPDRQARRDEAARTLEGTGVAWTRDLGFRNSYEAVAAATLVISYSSTMTFEATLFGRRFLLCMPDPLFGLNAVEGPAALCGPTYEQFEARVLELLAEPSPETRDYFRTLGASWIDPCDDPPGRVRDHVRRELGLAGSAA